jgi:hypothetical protein
MKRIIVFGIVLAAGGLLAAPAGAGAIDASATITATPVGPDFNYTISLTNTGGAGDDSIATFWFAWEPGKDFLASNPISASVPSGWRDVVTHGGANDGFAIQFDAVAPANDLAPGGSLVFGFQSADTPAQIAGNSAFYPTIPALTSFVYSTGPLQGDGDQFIVTPLSVPEPSSLALGILGAVGSLACRWRRRRVTG